MRFINISCRQILMLQTIKRETKVLKRTFCDTKHWNIEYEETLKLLGFKFFILSLVLHYQHYIALEGGELAPYSDATRLCQIMSQDYFI